MRRCLNKGGGVAREVLHLEFEYEYAEGVRNLPRPFVLARGMSSSESDDILKLGKGGKCGVVKISREYNVGKS